MAFPEISIVLPALNEAQNLPQLHERVAAVLQGLASYEIIIVDDGSSDGTLSVAKHLGAVDPAVRYVSFTRNFGHQQALRAGLRYARGGAVVVMDSDLQHPPALIAAMIAKWREGAEVVATRRDDSGAATGSLKGMTSRWFYRVVSMIGDVKIEPGSADFLLMDRKVVDTINAIEDNDFFIRGLVPWLGFRTARIDYTPEARQHGVSKYSLSRMVDFAVSGIVAHSIRPLRLSIYLAFLVFAFALLVLIYSVWSYLFVSRTVVGWTSVVAILAILGAAQLLVLGIIGEYVGRTLSETRRRPTYVVRETNCGADGGSGPRGAAAAESPKP